MQQDIANTSTDEGKLVVHKKPPPSFKDAFKYQHHSFSQMVLNRQPEAKELAEVKTNIVAQISHFRIVTKPVEDRMNESSDSSVDKDASPIETDRQERSLPLDSFIDKLGPYSSLENKPSEASLFSPRQKKKDIKQAFLGSFKALDYEEKKKVISHLKDLMFERSIIGKGTEEDKTPSRFLETIPEEKRNNFLQFLNS